jgi:hypothetical protein
VIWAGPSHHDGRRARIANEDVELNKPGSFSIRKPLLYPLSYGSGATSVAGLAGDSPHPELRVACSRTLRPVI